MTARRAEVRVALADEERAAAVWREHLDVGGVAWGGATVLDLGCGAGYLAKFLVEGVGVAEAHGVDLYPIWQASADLYGPETVRGVHLHAGDVRTIRAVQPLHFDAIVTVDTLPLLPPSVLMEVLFWCYDHLKPGGEMFAVFTAFTGFDGAGVATAAFPHAHLLFGEREVAGWLAENELTPAGYVNPACGATYLMQCVRAGFELVSVDREVEEPEGALLGEHRAKLMWLDEDELRGSRLSVRLRRPVSPNLSPVDHVAVSD